MCASMFQTCYTTGYEIRFIGVCYSYEALLCQTLLMFSWIISFKLTAIINIMKEFNVSMCADAMLMLQVFLSVAIVTVQAISCQDSIFLQGKMVGKSIFSSIADILFTNVVIDMNIS